MDIKRKRGRPMNMKKERPFYCGCGENFIKANELYKHYKIIHDNNPPPGSYKKRKRGRPINKNAIN